MRALQQASGIYPLACSHIGGIHMLALDQRKLRRNIRRTLKQATADQYAEGLRWYQCAHTFAVGLSTRYGLTLRQACGIVAALSPQCSWPKNMKDADALCRTGRAPTLGDSVRKARRIAAGADPLDVMHAPKTRAFFGNILNPETSTDVTIDRHACDLACGVRRGDAYRPELRVVTGYQQLAAAYRAVAAQLGMTASTVQAVTWLVWR
jgi:hypothetical protein